MRELVNPVRLVPADGTLETFRTIYQVLYYGAIFTAFLTAFYTFRAYSLTFCGPEKIPSEAGHHAHESPVSMTLPLAILAVCAVGAGAVFTNIPGGKWGENKVVEFLGQAPPLAAGMVTTTIPAEFEFHLSVAGLSTLAAVVGIGLALFLYLGDRREVSLLTRLFTLQGSDRLTDPQWVLQLERVVWVGALARGLRSVGLGFLVALVGYLLGAVSLVLFSAPLILLGNFVSPYKLSQNKFYFDEIYGALIVTPLQWCARVFYWLDRWLVDGLVNLVGSLPPLAGSLMRSLQMGLVQFYALAMLLGVLILIAARLLLAAG